MKLRSGRSYSLTRRPNASGSVLRSIASNAAPYIAGAVATRLRGAFSGSSTRTVGGSVRESPINTFQHDALNRYRYKRMPRRKRKRWVRFVRRVNHVELQMQPLQTYSYSGTNNVTFAANSQAYFGYMLGGVNVPNNDELWQIFRGAYNPAALSNAAPYKIYVKSLCLDMQITNTGSYPIILDVYRLRCRQDYGSNVQVDSQFTTAVSEVQYDSTGGSMTATKPQVTVFDVPNFCSYWKVLHKREVIIGAGNTTTMQMRVAKNRHLEGKSLATTQQSIPGYTNAFFIMARGCPSNRGTSGASQLDPGTLSWAYQIVVHYAIPPGKITEAGRTA